MVIRERLPLAPARLNRGFAMGLGVAIAGQLALGAWIVSQTFHPFKLTEVQARTPPIDVQTLTLERPKPAPPPPRPVTNRVRAPAGPVVVDTLRLPATAAKATSVAIATMTTPFADLGGAVRPQLLAPPSLPHAVTNPDWLERPSPDQVAKAYPETAPRAGLGGLVVLACDVTAVGTVVRCDAVSESPQGYGFSRAALSLSRFFRMRPATANGQAIASATLRIPIRLTLAGYAPDLTPYCSAYT